MPQKRYIERRLIELSLKEKRDSVDLAEEKRLEEELKKINDKDKENKEDDNEEDEEDEDNDEEDYVLVDIELLQRISEYFKEEKRKKQK